MFYPHFHDFRHIAPVDITPKAPRSSWSNINFIARDTEWMLLGNTYEPAEYTGYCCKSEGKSEKPHLRFLDRQ